MNAFLCNCLKQARNAGWSKACCLLAGGSKGAHDPGDAPWAGKSSVFALLHEDVPKPPQKRLAPEPSLQTPQDVKLKKQKKEKKEKKEKKQKKEKKIKKEV